MNKRFLSLLCFPLLLLSCGGNDATRADEMATPEEVMTSEEDVVLSGDGEWTDLLAGGNLDAWHKYGGDETGAAWKVDQDGVLYLDTSNKDGHSVVGGGDIVTDQDYSNYEFELEWKIGECGNSGIIYNIVESDDYDYPWLTGPEMQVLDNSCHPDAKIEKHRAGDLYDMISAKPENVKPAGQWNSVRIVNDNGYIEHWQNGEKVLSYTAEGEPWKAMIANSKFKDFADFGTSTSGKLGLQDHGDPVWFRNIRIRELSSK